MYVSQFDFPTQQRAVCSVDVGDYTLRTRPRPMTAKKQASGSTLHYGLPFNVSYIKVANSNYIFRLHGTELPDPPERQYMNPQ